MYMLCVCMHACVLDYRNLLHMMKINVYRMKHEINAAYPMSFWDNHWLCPFNRCLQFRLSIVTRTKFNEENTVNSNTQQQTD